MNIFPLNKYSHIFPDPKFACDEGILAYGGDLDPNRIITAYRNGIFPWYNENDPILWWSPNPRLILELNEFKVSKTLQKSINKNIFEVKFDTNFTQVMIECQKIKRNKQNKTWINNEVIKAYTKIHKMGFAHSFEAYLDGELVGGGYGIVIGDIFCGESMFSKVNDSSKVALYHLVQRLKKKNFRLIDCQIPTTHLKSLGAKTINRENFLNIIHSASYSLVTF
ncbi:leucyl/phenylalanyl-tRNA--protein transferase [Malaciobacter pacificus]|uniref:Leucyl/phenylalanyl-tRNA--protein transferase n=1 Tax=Malaciobacter pacificus TaxID=1080223 RepID=A0A5C2H833_9BACT|nr:leucyl/phenylalanyl-tRNA--protein transferase [Malaciobacter pacificus]QEP35097.1 leucyl, phenylalanyl-tRNA-protein transferase [Malaciobacter pacificus]GGD36738.1 leucyl/phenylalanyl-tRNA--protein transferase [Malaciobacter pacificus]